MKPLKTSPLGTEHGPALGRWQAQVRRPVLGAQPLCVPRGTPGAEMTLSVSRGRLPFSAARLSALGLPVAVVLTSSRNPAEYGRLETNATVRGFVPKAELSGASLARGRLRKAAPL